VVQVQPAISTEPLVPAFLKTYFQDGVINLAWQDVKLRDVMVKGYLVSKTEKGKDKWTNIFGADSVFPGSHFEDRNFEEGRSYEYKVQTVDEFCGKSKNAAINEVSIASSKVIPPSGLKAISIPDGVELEWAFGDTSISQYKIYRYQRCQKAESIGTTKFSVRNYLDKTAKKGQLYFYYLTSLDNKKRESEPGEEVGVRH
jgi:fibronectin type 3 domain-containing protein